MYSRSIFCEYSNRVVMTDFIKEAAEMGFSSEGNVIAMNRR